MFDIFSYSFMIRAFLAGGIVAIIAPLIGVFLVSRRYALLADSLAHVSLAGVALGLFLGLHPVLTALALSVVVAIIIEKMRMNHSITSDNALAIFLSGGLAIAIVLMSLAKGISVDLFSYLFGSITTVTQNDLYIMTALGSFVIGTLFIFYKALLALTFDEEAAIVNGIPATKLNGLFMVLTAITVSLAMRIVGVLLIGALMVIPVLAAMQLKLSFFKTALVAFLFSLAAVNVGLFVSYYTNLPSGGTIVVLSLLIFFSILGLKKLSRP